MRSLLAAALLLGLAACASAPKQSSSEPHAIPDSGTVHGAPLPAGGRKSPYAPAQEDPGKRGDYRAGGLYAPHIADSTPDDIPDVDAIPEPTVTAEPRSTVGNRASYSVLGKRYHVLDSAKGYVEQGNASYYGKKFHGRRTSNLEVYDMYAFTAAHKTLPLPSFVRVTNLDNGKSVTVRVNDRGPFHAGRIIDLSYAAAVKLGITQRGTGRVEVRALHAGDPQPTYASSANNPPPAVKNAKADSAMDKLVAAIPIASARAADHDETPTRTVPPPLPTTAAAAPGADWRFDMRQDGKAMTADEFDAWMKSRQVRVATGKPGTPDKPAPGATDAAAAAQPTIAAVAPPPPPPREAAANVAATTPREGDVTLQIAAFAARANADRALAMLRGAGIGDARLFDAEANGQKVWRLRVGPLAAAAAPELAARIVGLGFGQPQRVRE
ncbi:MAG TPA: septal ring lytic transglycosylase RlpA family protein [Lysobacter sp.]